MVRTNIWMGIGSCLVGLVGCAAHDDQSASDKAATTAITRWAADEETTTILGVREWSLEGTRERFELYGRDGSQVKAHAVFQHDAHDVVVDVDLPETWRMQYPSDNPSARVVSGTLPPSVAVALMSSANGAPPAFASSVGGTVHPTADTGLVQGANNTLVQPHCLIKDPQQMFVAGLTGMTTAQQSADLTANAFMSTCDVLADKDQAKCYENAARLAVNCGTKDDQKQRQEYDDIAKCVQQAQQQSGKPPPKAQEKSWTDWFTGMFSSADACQEQKAKDAVQADKDRRRAETDRYMQQLFKNSKQ